MQNKSQNISLLDNDLNTSIDMNSKNNNINYDDNKFTLKLAKLILANGDIFAGMAPQWQQDAAFGEVVFNTGMTGYEEALTDPSYSGQILTFTYPILGNYGVSTGNSWESPSIHAQGVICQTVHDKPRHHTMIKTFLQWLYEQKTPILIGVDTRSLTKVIRTHGVINGAFVFNQAAETKVLQLIDNGDNNSNIDSNNINSKFPDTTSGTVAQVSCKTVTTHGDGKYKVILVDCGSKQNILNKLLKFDVTVKVVPFDYDYFTHEQDNYDGIFLSNGPADPKECVQTIAILKQVLNQDDKDVVPVYGICLGSQLMALAVGADTYKLKFGHRGQNQPCIETSTNKCYLTSQNHGYAVDENTLPENWEVTFRHLNDNTVAGIHHKTKPFNAVQFHPEAAPGPHDSHVFFEQFFTDVVKYNNSIHFTNSTHNIKHNTLVTATDNRTPIKNVLILGSGGLRVGQAGEFDYSGSQAIKAFKQEGIRTVLVNPNIATVQTDKTMADQIYFQPLDLDIVTEIIKKEGVDAIALGFGGQTALNLGLELYKSGILNQYNVQVLGSSINTIDSTEDRGIFKDILNANNIKTPISRLAVSIDEARRYALEIGYPLMIRSGFSLGGLGSSRVNNEVELLNKVSLALSGSPQVLIEEYLTGWKEYEYEIVRDMAGNSLTICNMENLDPMGIHTGESIVIAPAQTLNDLEHQFLRNIALQCADIFNIIGECNIQFSVNPANGDYRVIEMNPRLSRSSALASKATGYPLAYIAAKLCLGYSLHELSNCITHKTTAYFEPALDYVVVKIPRWDTHKLKLAERIIGTEMKSVGESMGIGRTFPEALHKAIQALNIGATSLYDYPWKIHNIEHEIEFATDRRIFALFHWFFEAESSAVTSNLDKLEKAHKLSKIDWWFLTQIQEMALLAQEICQCNGLEGLNKELLLQAKQFGFSDVSIAKMLNSETITDINTTDIRIRELRSQYNIRPVIKQIDTLAGEFEAQTNYLYLTYHGQTSDIIISPSQSIASVCIIGSGPYSIGSSVEFDWCTVNLARQLRLAQKEVIIINSNPETVSTDYDESDRLYFEPLSLERVQDILDFEQPSGVCVSVGGQIANNLALPLYNAGYPILGTSPQDIDRAENRESFSQLLTINNIDQPRWIRATGQKEVEDFINLVGLPVLIRPSYVLSGSAMKVVFDKATLQEYLNEAFLISKEHPVVISEFIENAKELEVDGVAYKGNIIIHAISEHVENAGVHSGDATIIFPPERLYLKTVLKAKDIADHIVAGLNISGPFNMQLIAKSNELKVIECNVRASPMWTARTPSSS
jgi:carbamoyl-phosphate synthase large subunit/carbamoyl-phosphate synthase small subunit